MGLVIGRGRRACHRGQGLSTQSRQNRALNKTNTAISSNRPKIMAAIMIHFAASGNASIEPEDMTSGPAYGPEEY